jgi:hypothetical protein
LRLEVVWKFEAKIRGDIPGSGGSKTATGLAPSS